MMAFNEIEESINPSIILLIRLAKLCPKYDLLDGSGHGVDFDTWISLMGLVSNWLGCSNIKYDNTVLEEWKDAWFISNYTKDLVDITGLDIRYINYHCMYYCLSELNLIATIKQRKIL
jgi:hypothetical protein